MPRRNVHIPPEEQKVSKTTEVVSPPDSDIDLLRFTATTGRYDGNGVDDTVLVLGFSTCLHGKNLL